MNLLGLGSIEFAVANTRAGGHSLHGTRPDHGAVADVVFVRESALKDVRDDLHIAVAVRAEAFARLDAILVDDAQRPEPHEAGIVVIGKRKRVAAIEPAVLRTTALGGASNLHHGCCSTAFTSGLSATRDEALS